MTLRTTTHLNLPGTANAALEFYRTIFGGRIERATYADVGLPKDAPGADELVYGRLENDEGFRVMAYDVPGRHDADPALLAGSTIRRDGATLTDHPFFLSIRGETLEEVEAHWNGLANGAEIIEPLAASAWTPGFGMLTDRFGVTWVVDVQAPVAV
jgi:PhnB protein